MAGPGVPLCSPTPTPPPTGALSAVRVHVLLSWGGLASLRRGLSRKLLSRRQGSEGGGATSPSLLRGVPRAPDPLLLRPPQDLQFCRHPPHTHTHAHTHTHTTPPPPQTHLLEAGRGHFPRSILASANASCLTQGGANSISPHTRTRTHTHTHTHPHTHTHTHTLPAMLLIGMRFGGLTDR